VVAAVLVVRILHVVLVVMVVVLMVMMVLQFKHSFELSRTDVMVFRRGQNIGVSAQAAAKI
jgi:hypothetical protein